LSVTKNPTVDSENDPDHIINQMTIAKSASSFESFQWSLHPEAFRFVCRLATDFLARCPDAAAFAEKIHRETGTRFVDWIDHIRLSRCDPRSSQLERFGYRIESELAEYTVYTFNDGVLPVLLTSDGSLEVGIKVESVADFLAANHLQREADGSPWGSLRTCNIYSGHDCSLKVIERRSTSGFNTSNSEPDKSIPQHFHLEKFRTRPRIFEHDEDGFDAANGLIDDAIQDLGPDLTCHLWFAAEREFWLRRNHAGQAQKARQDRLGLGLANHDHHTYRSSRRNFTILIATWEKLGLKCRERFYAGREAGWGAQVMEQPVTGIVTFNDVDLTPDELIGDFSHDGLEEQNKLGTVGLWCGLHGDSFLQSGMHHLAAKFDFELLTKQLAEEMGVKMMAAFSDFPHLRQAFTEGERWKVHSERIERLRTAAMINDQQAGQFRSSGAIGSHLENLERNDGFKGFNQAGVSEIIHATDPRKNIGA
jgi:hypothetical protein